MTDLNEKIKEKEIFCIDCEIWERKTPPFKTLQHDKKLDLHVGTCPKCKSKTTFIVCPLCKKETRLMVMDNGEVWGGCDNCKKHIWRKKGDKEFLEADDCWECGEGETFYMKDLLREKDYFKVNESGFDGDGIFCKDCMLKRLKEKKERYRIRLEKIDKHLEEMVKDDFLH